MSEEELERERRIRLTVSEDAQAYVNRIQSALGVMAQFAHKATRVREKQWVLDQVARCLLGNSHQYQWWVKELEKGNQGPDTYEWDPGTRPFIRK